MLEDLTAGRLRTMVTHVESWVKRMEYATRECFGGLSLKTTSGRFSGLVVKIRVRFWRKSVAAHGDIASLASRQS
jgi:hypothetical protein